MKEKPEYLRLALDSMIHQTVSPDEIVLVEDGPLTNELYTIVNEYIQKYPILVNTVVNEKNCGLGLALNCGLHVCRNDLVARMDTDDISKPDRCEKQLMRFDENPNLAIVGAWVDEFSDSPDQVISVRVVPTDYEDIYQFAKRRSSFNHPVVMYKKSVVFKHGGYADLKRNQDVDLFGRMLFAGEKA
ncbi:MAG: glycosyltransferase, partial [Clostridia bacterium]